MKRTHKRSSLGDVAAIVAKAGSVTEAARQLGVNTSTIRRWRAAGHVGQPAIGERARQDVIEAQTQPAGDWAAKYKASRTLDESQLELVELAAEALLVAKNREERSEARLSAMGRFQAIVKQLAGVDVAPQAQPVKAPVRPVSGDPRALLVAVK